VVVTDPTGSVTSTPVTLNILTGVPVMSRLGYTMLTLGLLVLLIPFLPLNKRKQS
jgi:hypothetical protein